MENYDIGLRLKNMQLYLASFVQYNIAQMQMSEISFAFCLLSVRSKLRDISMTVYDSHTYLHVFSIFCSVTIISRTQWPRGLRRGSAVDSLLGLRVRILLGHGYLSVVSFAWCQVEFSATGRPSIQKSPTDCGVSLCMI